MKTCMKLFKTNAIFKEKKQIWTVSHWTVLLVGNTKSTLANKKKHILKNILKLPESFGRLESKNYKQTNTSPSHTVSALPVETPVSPTLSSKMPRTGYHHCHMQDSCFYDHAYQNSDYCIRGRRLSLCTSSY